MSNFRDRNRKLFMQQLCIRIWRWALSNIVYTRSNMLREWTVYLWGSSWKLYWKWKEIFLGGMQGYVCVFCHTKEIAILILRKYVLIFCKRFFNYFLQIHHWRTKDSIFGSVWKLLMIASRYGIWSQFLC